MALGGDHPLFGAQFARRQNPCQVFKIIDLGPRFGAPLAIQDQVPGDAHQPDAIVAHLSQLAAVAKNAEKGLLHHVFRVGCIARNRIGHAVKRGRILFHQRGHPGVRILLWYGHRLGLQPSDELSFNCSHNRTETVAYRDASYALSARAFYRRSAPLPNSCDRGCRAASMIIRHACPFPDSPFSCWRSAGSFRPLCATLVARGHETDLSGVYQGHAPATDAARRVFTLNLASDGTAMLTTQYIGKDDVTQHGRWTHSGSQIVLTFDPIGSNGPPRPITFRYRDHELEPGSLGSQ